MQNQDDDSFRWYPDTGTVQVVYWINELTFTRLGHRTLLLEPSVEFFIDETLQRFDDLYPAQMPRFLEIRAESDDAIALITIDMSDDRMIAHVAIEDRIGAGSPTYSGHARWNIFDVTEHGYMNTEVDIDDTSHI